MQMIGIGLSLIALASTSAWAADGSVDASKYTVHCDTIIGTISFSPPLSLSGNATSDEGKVEATLAGCTATPDEVGNPPVTVESGKISGKLFGPSNNCSILISGITTSGDLTIRWKTTPELASSSSTLTPERLDFALFTPGFPFTGMYGAFHIGPPLSGVSVGGSFQGTDGGASSVVDGTTAQDVNLLLDECASTDGLKTINFGFGDLTLG